MMPPRIAPRLRTAPAWFLLALGAATATAAADDGPPPASTREFEIRNDRAYLGGQEVRLWGMRCGNALLNASVTERHINSLDAMQAHGINLIGVYIQGTNGGSPNPDAGLDGFRRNGELEPPVARRLEALIREADRRGMVVMVGLVSPRKDQNLYDEAAIRRAVESTAEFLEARKLRNVFVDLVHEFNNAERIDHPIFREPNGAANKAKLTGWFKSKAPAIEVGVCPSEDTGTADEYPGMEVRIIQKAMPIPANGFVVNVEITRHDFYENDGIFSRGDVAEMRADWERYQSAPNSAMMFHAAYLQGVSNKSGSAPNPEAGGYGTSQDDRGYRFFFDWLRDHVGRWEYPRHVPASSSAAARP